MKKSQAILLAVVMAIFAIGSHLPVSACDGEIEWESTPLNPNLDVKYTECMEILPGEPLRKIRQVLRIRVQDGAPFEDYSIVIKGRPLTTLRTDDRGEAEFLLVRHGLMPDDEGRPVGNKRINDGDLCEVFVQQDSFADVFVRL